MNRFGGIRRQITLLFAVVLILVNIALWLFFTVARADMESDLDETLIGAAELLASGIRGEYLLTLEPNDEDTRTYRNLRERLLAVTRAVRLNRALVVDRGGNLWVDSSNELAIGDHVFLLDASAGEMFNALNGGTSTTVAYHDIDGRLFKSAFAPVRDLGQQIVGILVAEASADFLGQLDAFKRVMVFVTTISVIALFALVAIISLSIVRPVLGLARAADSITAGQYTTVIPRGVSELRHLASAFNEMSQALRYKENELKALYQDESRRAQETQRYAEAILRSIANGVVSIDENRVVRVCNAEACRLLGVNESDVLGRPFDAAAMPRPLVEMLELSFASREVVRHTQLAFRNSEGHHLHVAATAAPNTGSSPGAVAVNLVLTDQTGLVELQEKVKRQETLAAIGQLAAHVAHEVRNPLGSMKIYMDLLARTNLDEVKRRHFIDKVTGEISRLDDIVTDFLEYSAPTRMSVSEFSLGSVVHDAILFSQKETNSAVRHEDNHAEFIDCRIRADRNQIMQMLLNLEINAAEAMLDGGVVETTLRKTEIAHEEGPRPAISVSVSDTGVGIPEEQRQEIFEPFFSTKSLGTGLGLALVQRVVENHEGTIDVESSVAVGTTVTVTLPIRINLADPKPVQRVVDDETNTAGR